MRARTLALFLLVAPGIYGQGRYGEGLTPAALLKPGVDSWPTYNGDYSGRRNSPLEANHHFECGRLDDDLDLSRQQLRRGRIWFGNQVDADRSEWGALFHDAR